MSSRITDSYCLTIDLHHFYTFLDSWVTSVVTTLLSSFTRKSIKFLKFFPILYLYFIVSCSQYFRFQMVVFCTFFFIVYKQGDNVTLKNHRPVICIVTGALAITTGATRWQYSLICWNWVTLWIFVSSTLAS